MSKLLLFKIVRIIGILDAMAIIIFGLLYFLNVINVSLILPLLLAILAFSATISRKLSNKQS